MHYLTVHAGKHSGRWELTDRRRRETGMIYYALVFLIVGLVAGALGLFGIAAIAGQISWILFLIGIVLLVIHLVSGRRVPIR
jgi:uncharacterized membrane protein YtjA (UPF0391 family)